MDRAKGKEEGAREGGEKWEREGEELQSCAGDGRMKRIGRASNAR